MGERQKKSWAVTLSPFLGVSQSGVHRETDFVMTWTCKWCWHVLEPKTWRCEPESVSRCGPTSVTDRPYRRHRADTDVKWIKPKPNVKRFKPNLLCCNVRDRKGWQPVLKSAFHGNEDEEVKITFCERVPLRPRFCINFTSLWNLSARRRCKGETKRPHN